MTDDPTSERTALYRLYNADDLLLYVGISSTPATRMGQHAARKAWWPQVADRKLEWFPTRTQAAEAEIAAIREERPVHNHTHNSSLVLGLLPAAEADPLRPRLQRVDRDERGAALRITADLRALIMSRDVPIGTKLPSTAEFVQKYQTSGTTVQLALRALKAEGFVVGKPGSGVFVTSPTPRNLPNAASHAIDIEDAGYVAPPAAVAETFGVPESTPVWRERARRLADDWPIGLVTSYRREADQPQGVSEYVDLLSVRLPTSAELVALSLADEVPVTRIYRVLHGENGEALEVQVVIEPGHLCQRQYTFPAPE
ncbi:GntR family transcriptional regulator [Streptomyces anulatus]|uniref:GntR family transcriptional regulator n=1 Tax=Streptomyces anulatus TaxID=1892 RepID=UPI00386C27F8|nr:GntR family transcriptional regulator [Streptomyces anulatus]